MSVPATELREVGTGLAETDKGMVARERSAHLAAILNVFSYSFSFVNAIIMGRVFGATSITDAFYLAVLLPNTLVAILGNSMACAVQSLLSRRALCHSDRAKLLLAAVIPLASLIVAAGIHLALPAPGLLRLLGSGGPAQRLLASAWFVAFCFGLLLSGCSTLLMASLQAAGRYAAASTYQALCALVQGGLMLLLRQAGARALPVSYVAAQAVGFLLVVVLLRTTPKAGPIGEQKLSVPKAFSALVPIWWPMVFGALLGNLTLIFQRSLLGQLPSGELTSFTYAWGLGNLPMLLFTLLLNAPTITEVGRHVSSPPRLSRQIGWMMLLSFAIMGPLALLLIDSADSIVALMYGSRLGEHTQTCTRVLQLLGLVGLIQLPAVVPAKAFAAVGDTRTSTTCTVIAGVIGAAMMVPFFHWFGGAHSLVFATLVEACINTVLLSIAANRRWPGVRRGWKMLASMLAAVIVSGLVASTVARGAIPVHNTMSHLIRTAATMLGGLGLLALGLSIVPGGRRALRLTMGGRLPLMPPAEMT